MKKELPRGLCYPAASENGLLEVQVICVQVILHIPKSNVQLYLLNLGSWLFISPFERCASF